MYESELMADAEKANEQCNLFKNQRLVRTMKKKSSGKIRS
jgi:hypothetical protein